MLKRSGCGHNQEGAATTSLGELAVECPACPHLLDFETLRLNV
jgi:hypothetical protein